MRRTVPIKWLHRGLAALFAALAPAAAARLTATGADPDVDLIRLAAALVLCLVLGVAIILFLRRRLPGHGGVAGANGVRIVESVRLGTRGELHVIDFEGRRILLAANPNGVVPIIDVPLSGAIIEAPPEQLK